VHEGDQELCSDRRHAIVIFQDVGVESMIRCIIVSVLYLLGAAQKEVA